VNSLGAILDEAARLLDRHGRDAPRLCAELLAAEVLSVSRLEILVNRDMPVSQRERQSIEALVRRRAGGEPLAYILGRKEFYGRELAVTPQVLVPRPETECLVDMVKLSYASGQGVTFVDVGTGSGNLAVALALELPGSSGIAMDISHEALTVARRNILHYRLQGRLLLLQADLTAGLRKASCDVLVANPPYLSRAEHAAAGREVRLFEPQHALIGGEGGLEIIARLLKQLPAVLKPGGRFFVEIGETQPEALKPLLAEASDAWRDIRFLPDLQGRPRVLSGQCV